MSWEDDFLSHTRTVHLALIATSFGLVVASTLSLPNDLVLARDQAERLSRFAQQAFSDERFDPAKETEPAYLIGIVGGLNLPLPSFDTLVADTLKQEGFFFQRESGVLKLAFGTDSTNWTYTANQIWFGRIGSTGRLLDTYNEASRDDVELLSRALYAKAEDLHTLRLTWNYTKYADLQAGVTVDQSGISYFKDGEPLDPRLSIEIQHAKSLKPTAPALVRIWASIEPLPHAGQVLSLRAHSTGSTADLLFDEIRLPLRAKRVGPGRLTGLVDRERGLFDDSFAALLSQKSIVRDRVISSIATDLASRASAPDEPVEVLGFKVPRSAVSGWGLILLVSIQAYFVADLRRIQQLSISGDTKRQFAWIALFPSFGPRLLTLSSVTVLPLSAAVILAYLGIVGSWDDLMSAIRRGNSAPASDIWYLAVPIGHLFGLLLSVGLMGTSARFLPFKLSYLRRRMCAVLRRAREGQSWTRESANQGD